MDDHGYTVAEPGADMVLTVLAAMEAYRLKTKHNRKSDCPDYDIRVCQSILAEACGAKNRNDWTGAIQAKGLFDYSGDYNEQYHSLIERMRV